MRRPLRVLLIDDNRHGTLARRAFLEEAGYEVETAKSGPEGAAHFSEADFDIAVTDYRASKAAGAEVVKALRAARPQARIVILSGYVKSLGLTEESTGADAVLPKGPSETQDLLRTIARLTRKRPASEKQRPGVKKKAAGR
jgi:two-component system response regulator RegA